MHIAKRFSSLGVASKLFLFLAVAIFLIYSVQSWKNLQDTESLFDKQITEDSNLLVNGTNWYFNTFVDTIHNILVGVSMRMDLAETGNKEMMDSFLRVYAEQNPDVVKTIYLVMNAGEVYSSHALLYEIKGNEHLDYLVRLSTEKATGVQWSEPYMSPLTDRTVAFTKSITDKHNNVLGLAIVEVNLNYLSDAFRPYLSSNKAQTTLVLSERGQMIMMDRNSPLLPFQKGIYPPQLNDAFMNKLAGLSNGVSEIGLADAPLPMKAVKSNYNRLGWSIVSLVDKRHYYHNLDVLKKNYWSAFFIMLTILLFSLYMISRLVMRPITKLATKMDRVNSLEISHKIYLQRNDEIGQLANSFNNMMNRMHMLATENDELARLKKEYQLKMLQSQIRPHLLYNTLACIHNLAKMQELEKLGQTIRSLIGLLSFTFDKTHELIPLEEELEGLRMYIQIQQTRYDDSFGMDIRIPERLLAFSVLKLTLQPLVENAIFHGLAPKGGGIIRVYGRIDQRKIVLYVRDNGAGMSRQTLNGLLRNEKLKGSRGSLNSIGVMNVHERIRIHYGAPYGLRIASKEGIGTIVKATIPALPYDALRGDE